MAKKKKQRRLNAAKLTKQTSLKRDVAYFVATQEAGNLRKKSLEIVTVINMLTMGHRGYISYNEKDLCKLLSKHYNILLSEYQEYLEIKSKIDRGEAIPYEDELLVSRYINYKLPQLQKCEDLMNQLAENILVGDGKF